MITLAVNAVEKSTYVITASFTDEAGAAVVPNAGLTWSLFNESGAVINSRSSVALTPAASVDIVLSGADLALSGAADTRVRHLLVEGTYNGSLGSNLPLKGQARFVIDDLVGVS